jgi:hypothetical protein
LDGAIRSTDECVIQRIDNHLRAFERVKPPVRHVEPRSDLENFAEAVSSASDPALAKWQKQGLEHPRSRDGLVMWSIVAVSLCAGLAVLAAGLWFVVRPSLFLLTSTRPVVRRSGVVVLLSLMIAVIAGAGTAFAIVQGASRLAFALLGRRRAPIR